MRLGRWLQRREKKRARGLRGSRDRDSGGKEDGCICDEGR